MLLCSTGEAVMRLDRTDLAHDARRLQDIYLHDQYHETMLQYLQNQLHQCGQNSLFMQVRQAYQTLELIFIFTIRILKGRT